MRGSWKRLCMCGAMCMCVVHAHINQQSSSCSLWGLMVSHHTLYSTVTHTYTRCTLTHVKWSFVAQLRHCFNAPDGSFGAIISHTGSNTRIQYNFRWRLKTYWKYNCAHSSKKKKKKEAGSVSSIAFWKRTTFVQERLVLKYEGQHVHSKKQMTCSRHTECSSLQLYDG